MTISADDLLAGQQKLGTLDAEQSGCGVSSGYQGQGKVCLGWRWGSGHRCGEDENFSLYLQRQHWLILVDFCSLSEPNNSRRGVV